MDEPIIMKRKNKKISKAVIINILLVTIMSIAGAYAFFNYTAEGEEEAKLIAGNVYLYFDDGTSEILLSEGIFPETVEKARARTDNVINFTVEGINTTTNKDIYYEIKLIYGTNDNTRTRFEDSDLRFDLIEKIGEQEKIVLQNATLETINNTRIWVNTIDSNSEFKATYQLRMWLGEHVVISDTSPDASYTTGEYAKKYASVKVLVNGDFQEKKMLTFYETLEETLSSYLLSDDGDARIVSGNGNDENLKNYVWYSGKLWRVVALNNDKTIKLVMDNNITVIVWGNTTNFNGNYVYQWLNEDFLDTLYNYANIIETEHSWDVTQTTNLNKPTTKTSFDASVGLLTAYEYSQSYKNAESVELGYLNNNFKWWLINAYDSSKMLLVDDDGSVISTSYAWPNGVRPVVNLSSDIKIRGGNGSKNIPYLLDGDLTEAVSGVTKLNERVSGEFVNFDNELYRIVSIDNNITKLTKVDFLKENNDLLLKSPPPFSKYGIVKENVCVDNIVQIIDNYATYRRFCDNFWDYYLNYVWKDRISEKYRKMLVKGRWYLGEYTDDGNYKTAICTVDTIAETTKNCTKTTSVFDGYIGLGRVGEPFTSRNNSEYLDTLMMATITINNGNQTVFITDSDSAAYITSLDTHSIVRPSLFLSSEVIIAGGLGTENSPYKITMN